MNKLKKFILKVTLKLSSNKIIPIPDKKHLELLGELRMDKKINIDNPQTFNEKLQWLKLYDRNPEYTKMVDKYEAKKYVASIIGEEYIIPTIGTYDNFDEINFNELPNQFVMKCTHDSGGNIICKDKSKLNFSIAKEKIEKCLKRNFYNYSKEWPYKNVKPRIIIEEYMNNFNENELKDYKLFCFNGMVKIILVCSDRRTELKETWFDVNWNYINLEEGGHKSDSDIEKPKNLELMVKLAEKLSIDVPFVRIDFYEIEEKVYFGEITFFPASGFEKFNPEKYDKILGDMLELPKEKREEK